VLKEVAADSLVLVFDPLKQSTPEFYRGDILQEDLGRQSPILGNFESKGNRLVFKPTVPLNLGQSYTMVCEGQLEHFQVDLPDDYQRLEVEAVFPSAPEVPANILKWYLRFNRPVSPVSIYQYIHFTHQNGDTISRAVLPLTNALLNDAGTQLTLWIEPGRQKRSLGPNEKLGAVFQENHSYQLSIAKALKDQNGVSMLQDWKVNFTTTSADRQSPGLNDWTLNVPNKNTNDALIIDTKDQLDFASTLAALRCIGKDGRPVNGDFHLLENEQIISFIPSVNWLPGTYKIILAASLEDLAGNNLNRLFDQDNSKKLSAKDKKQIYTIDYIID
jgi:hypothetical protein